MNKQVAEWLHTAYAAFSRRSSAGDFTAVSEQVRYGRCACNLHAGCSAGLRRVAGEDGTETARGTVRRRICDRLGRTTGKPRWAGPLATVPSGTKRPRARPSTPPICGIKCPARTKCAHAFPGSDGSLLAEINRRACTKAPRARVLRRLCRELAVKAHTELPWTRATNHNARVRNRR